ncbi:hypothetical protein, partial [Bifidobacterium bifidum]|uniref:hypothetical protein n=1 Tax=Bifidobacterium bifidum TaxID=1681 RepID=UPI0031B5F50E
LVFLVLQPPLESALLMPPWPVLSAAVLEVTRTGMSCMMPVGHCSARMLSGVAGRSVTTMSKNGALKTRRVTAPFKTIGK